MNCFHPFTLSKAMIHRLKFRVIDLALASGMLILGTYIGSIRYQNTYVSSLDLESRQDINEAIIRYGLGTGGSMALLTLLASRVCVGRPQANNPNPTREELESVERFIHRSRVLTDIDPAHLSSLIMALNTFKDEYQLPTKE